MIDDCPWHVGTATRLKLCCWRGKFPQRAALRLVKISAQFCFFAIIFCAASPAKSGDLAAEDVPDYVVPGTEFVPVAPAAVSPVLPAEEAQQNILEIIPGTALEEINLELCLAAAGRDPHRLSMALATGASPNAILPFPPPTEFLQIFPSGFMNYYLRKESPITPLMLAAAADCPACIDLLLRAGADPWIKTGNSKSFALQFAARLGNVGSMRLLLGRPAELSEGEIVLRVDLAAQRVYVFQNGKIMDESPVSTGKKSKPTPPGNYVITDKHRDWKSTIYHVKMPFFLRFSSGELGFHAGRLPGYPASSGCIRLPAEKAREFFELLPVGTVVLVE